MPITMVSSGSSVKVSRVAGSGKTKQRLAELGFAPGTLIDVIQSHGGNMIVRVKDSKLALTREMANKIMVDSL